MMSRFSKSTNWRVGAVIAVLCVLALTAAFLGVGYMVLVIAFLASYVIFRVRVKSFSTARRLAIAWWLLHSILWFGVAALGIWKANVSFLDILRMGS